MTADYARILWKPAFLGGSQATIPGQQWSLRRQKQYPALATVPGDFGPNYPVAVPFPNTLDQHGVAYPAGLVAVFTAHELPTPLTPGLTYNEMIEAAMFGPDGGVPTNSFLSGKVFLVPGVLPVGYTANLHTTWERDGDLATGYKSATGDGFPAWTPAIDWYGNETTIDLSFASAATIDSDSIGLRKLQVRMTDTGATIPTYTGSWVVNISHDAAGGATPLSGGDTPDGSASFAQGVWAGVAGAWATPYVDVGALTPSTHGVLTSWVAVVDSSGVTPTGFYTGALSGVYLAHSARLDVPLPMTVPGPRGLIAPGGTV
jgi:hypothetical protein